jgi:hypothetical protein
MPLLNMGKSTYEVKNKTELLHVILTDLFPFFPIEDAKKECEINIISTSNEGFRYGVMFRYFYLNKNKPYCIGFLNESFSEDKKIEVENIEALPELINA